MAKNDTAPVTGSGADTNLGAGTPIRLSQRAVIIRIARLFLGVPYKWGGYDWHGYDCSGLVIDCLQTVGLLPPRGDWTAARLARMFEPVSEKELKLGDLVFYGRGRVTHIMIYSGGGEVIGARGGNSKTNTVAEARRRGAEVSTRPLHYRPDLLRCANVLRPTWTASA